MDDKKFSELTVEDWKCFLAIKEEYFSDVSWIFRGQPKGKSLKTALERACADYGIDQQKAPQIECEMIRDFRRHYDGPDRDIVKSDTLYCLSLMQHHGAPTRLLDFTYSPYTAFFISIEQEWIDPDDEDEKCQLIWCVNAIWLKERIEGIEGIAGKGFVDRRSGYNRENDFFEEMYGLTWIPRKFVFAENSFDMVKRRITQSGVFLCPGDVSVSFENNLKALTGWDSGKNVMKLKLKMKKKAYEKALMELFRMNIDHATLFPGLDGLAKSLKTKMPLYNKFKTVKN